VLSLTVLWPVPLRSSWQLITYTVGEVVSQARLEPQDGRVVGPGDTVVNALVAPKPSLTTFVSESAQGSYNLKEPGVGPEWGVSLSLELLLP
jgi:hypothetical protein